MTRYTANRLDEDLQPMNAELERIKHDFRFVIGGRYGYTAIDLATPELIERHCVSRMLVGGTPRECLAAAQEYMNGAYRSATT